MCQASGISVQQCFQNGHAHRLGWFDGVYALQEWVVGIDIGVVGIQEYQQSLLGRLYLCVSPSTGTTTVTGAQSTRSYGTLKPAISCILQPWTWSTSMPQQRSMLMDAAALQLPNENVFDCVCHRSLHFYLLNMQPRRTT